MEYFVQVKPGSKKGPLVVTGDQNELTVYVRERAVDGKANEAVVELLAEHFSVPKLRIVIVRGQASRKKLVRVD